MSKVGECKIPDGGEAGVAVEMREISQLKLQSTWAAVIEGFSPASVQFKKGDK
jgi:hypothetical protein